MGRVLQILVLGLCFGLLVSCGEVSEKHANPVKYSVMIPQFTENNGLSAKAIELDADDQFLFFRLFSSIPIIGFSRGSVENGEELKATIVGELITLKMTLVSDNYVFEGAGDNVYVKITVYKDNTGFDYVIVCLCDCSSHLSTYPHWMLVHEGHGEIEGNGYSSTATMYAFNSWPGVIGTQKDRAIIHSNGEKQLVLRFDACGETITKAGWSETESFSSLEYQSFIDLIENPSGYSTSLWLCAFDDIGIWKEQKRFETIDDCVSEVSSWGDDFSNIDLKAEYDNLRTL